MRDEEPSGSAAFYSNLPAKPMAAGWLIRDASDAVLLVRPAYKGPWEIPGGVVEAGESPREDARRELLEELGSEREPGPLLCVDWTPAVDGVRSDALRFVFDGGVVDVVTVEATVIDTTELLEWRFVRSDDLDGFLRPRLARRVRACHSATATVYLEGAQPPA